MVVTEVRWGIFYIGPKEPAETVFVHAKNEVSITLYIGFQFLGEFREYFKRPLLMFLDITKYSALLLFK